MKFWQQLGLATLFIFNFSLGQFQSPHPDTIQQNLRQHVSFLGSDSLRGRAVGSVGEQRAADYIRNQLQALNIQPAADNHSYFQHFPLHASQPLPSSELAVYFNEDEKYLLLNRDYVLYSSGAETFVPTPIPLVFVGYGIVAPEFDHNDYRDLDVHGKIVVALGGEPLSEDVDYFAGHLRTIYSNPESKKRLALARGARGSIIIPNPNDPEEPSWERRMIDYSFEDVTLAYSVAENLSLIVNPKAAHILFQGCEFQLADVLRMHRSHTMSSFPLQTRLSFRGKFEEREFYSQNVIGKLNSGKRQENTVALIAHYDHLGVGKPVAGDSIYNGVVDNAMGVAGLLELARLFKDKPLRRSLIFLFVSGEEKGTLGSKYYVDHAVVPHYRCAAAVNIDGLAIFAPFQSVVGIGADYSTLGETLQEVAASLDLSVETIRDKPVNDEAFIRSDQIAFARAGVPALMIMDGLDLQNHSRDEALHRHIRWLQNRYHTPFDDLQQPLSWPAAVEHVQFLYYFIDEIANSRGMPKWYPGTPFVNERLRSIIEKR